MSGTHEIYADNYTKPRVIPILLDVLMLALGFWVFIASHAFFEPRLNFFGFCVFMVGLLFFVLELFHRLWPVRIRRLKDGTKVTIFYLGWDREVERTEFADGRCPIYSTSDGVTYYDPRELIQAPQVRTFIAGHSKVKPSTPD